MRVELFDDEIESLSYFDPLTGEVLRNVPRLTVFPKTHYVTPRETLVEAVDQIREELKERLEQLRSVNKLVEAQRLEQRTRFDMEMIMELGYCAGIENYSRFLSGRQAGEPPPTLFDYLPSDALLVDRREPRDHPPARRHVPRRPLAQGDPGRVRVPAALGTGQPPAALRGVRAPRAADDLRLGDARPLRAHARGPGGGAGGPAHRSGRPGGRGAPGIHAGRRPAIGDPRARGGR